MKNKSKDPITLNELIFEIRYKANPKILDLRGTWAEKISDVMELSEWRIIQNRLDIFDKSSKNRAFVGFNSAGFISNDVPTAHYFPDRTLKFLKFIMGLDGFNTPLQVDRIGVRQKSYTEFTKGFDELCSRYESRYLMMSEKLKTIMGAKLVDIGGSLNFNEKHGNFNTQSGPMKEDQAHQFLNIQGTLPEVGLYIDIDYWQKPHNIVSDEKLFDLISTFASESWAKHQKIIDLIFED
ncbi:MAG: hypothetical protein ISR82_00130 [Candidatus Marinimicrobia bacterium]|nr:hypothetical protein [Candidatus Neomarinimicrobiota bacterium]MBL7009610.1 hypothetical protein [Candidatus Neomarinimicrobiota bacterium]MBL7029647.1 hypothetical protein [Candidatus Neomarinimicrobiota bacterium]